MQEFLDFVRVGMAFGAGFYIGSSVLKFVVKSVCLVIESFADWMIEKYGDEWGGDED